MNEENRDELRKHLEKDGTVSKLNNALVKLFQESERPEDAIMFIRQHLCLECTTESKVMELSKKLDGMTEEKKKIDRELSMAKSLIRPSNSEADLLLLVGVKALWADEACESMLKNYLDKEVFEHTKDLKSNGRGSLLDNIKSGLDNHDFPVGVYASDPDAYLCFSELYDPLLEELHDTTQDTKHPVEIDWGDMELFEDLDETGLFIKRIRVTCRRALDGYSFASKLKVEEFQEIMNKIQPVLENITDNELKGTFYALDGIDPTIAAGLKKDGVMFTKDEDKFLLSANGYRCWPAGRAVFVNEARTFQVRINEEEHLQVISIEKGSNLKTCYQRLAKAMDIINQSDLTFAKDPRLGFFAFNPANLGNSIQVSALARLPKIMQPENQEKMEELLVQIIFQSQTKVMEMLNLAVLGKLGSQNLNQSWSSRQELKI
ncbi:unnamed protein product [Diamesa hyperborea]